MATITMTITGADVSAIHQEIAKGRGGTPAAVVRAAALLCAHEHRDLADPNILYGDTGAPIWYSLSVNPCIDIQRVVDALHAHSGRSKSFVLRAMFRRGLALAKVQPPRRAGPSIRRGFETT